MGLGPPDFFQKLGMVLTSMTLEYLKIEFLQILGMVISILNSLNKDFERLLHKQLHDYLETNDLLPLFQYGYRKRHSTCHATLHFAKEIETVLDNKKVAVSVFMYLSKAFDTVDKTILCKKTP